MARTLIYDIETTPLVSYTWGTYQTDVIRVIQEWYILCFAYKWLGDKKTIVVAQDDFRGYKSNMRNDKNVVKELYKLFDQADIVIAHNGDRFDRRKSNARFAYHKMSPPSPYQTIDTLKVARREFAFTSNKLDDLGDHLGLGRKVQHSGFDLWLGCMGGDEKSWSTMKKYVKQDVNLLEKVYIELLPWITNHPNMALIEGRPDSCTKCGSPRIKSKGFRYTRTSKYRRYVCKDCGAYSTDRKKEPEVVTNKV